MAAVSASCPRAVACDRGGGRRSARGGVVSHLLVLLAGLGLGVALTLVATERWAIGGVRDAALEPSTPASVAPASPYAAPAGPLVELRVATSSGTQHRATAVVLAADDAVAGDGRRLGVLVPLPSLLAATEVWLATADGSPLTLDEVAAVSAAEELVLLRATGPDARARLAPLVLVDAPAASLHLGRQLTVLAADGRRAGGWVDSAAHRSALGGYYYDLDAGAAALPAPAPLLDAAGRVIGLAVTPPAIDAAPAAPATTIALDAASLRELFAQADRRAPTPLRSFVDSFFRDVPVGRLLTARAARARQDYAAIVAAATPLVAQGWPFDEVAAPLLEEAYQALAGEALLTAPRSPLPRRLLDEAAALLDWSAPRRQLAARAAWARGDLGAALAHLNAGWRAAGSDDPARGTLRDAARRLLLDALAAGTVPDPELVALLETQIAIDADYAPFHEWLGRLLFDAQRYREALTPLYRARSLGAPQGELATLISRAEERLYAPGLSVVPVLNQGATLYVHASVPGLAGTWRFILDTGASVTAISPELLQRTGAVARRGTVQLATANGQVTAPLVTIRELDVAGARVSHLDVVVLDSLGEFDGLLGLSFLDHFNMELDRNRSEMTLRLR